MNIFFYGLFMDRMRLLEQGYHPSEARTAVLKDYQLHIGERATLLPSEGVKVCGVVMSLTQLEVDRLYSGASVVDYKPVPVQVELLEGGHSDATVYNLSKERLKGRNSEYARRLMQLAEKLGLPESYVKALKMRI